MVKAWSITTTVRNPERLRDFLITLQPFIGQQWNRECQQRYQKLLIKNRLYGYGNQQFYHGLPTDLIKVINNLEVELDDSLVDRIVEIKDYKDFAMRGRQSLNPLTKFGFVVIENGTLKMSNLGERLITNEKDLGQVFLASFTKWQLPNPLNNDYPDNGTYNVVPFVATLRLIRRVNDLEVARGEKPKGLSKREFSFFVPTLIRHEDIEAQAQKVIEFRDLQKGKSLVEAKKARDSYRQVFAEDYLGTSEEKAISKFLKNLRDYGDNTIRYFRLTKFIRVRGGGFYVDLEPNRQLEIETLFEGEFYKPKYFASKTEYVQYLSENEKLSLPWETKEKLLEIANSVMADVMLLQNRLGVDLREKNETGSLNTEQLVEFIEALRLVRNNLQEQENHEKAQPIDSISQYILELEQIYEVDNRALRLEYLATMGLHALNDAQEIRPNYPVGDDNEPTSTAPGGMADIECYYKSFAMICEVTMLNGRDQWFNEGQPVMRHLRNFENRQDNALCVFIAPSIHPDSSETFWFANTIGYKGSKQKIAPIKIKQFIEILKTLRQLRESRKAFTHNTLRKLFEDIAESARSVVDSDVWIAGIQSIIDKWSVSLVSATQNK